MLSRKKTPTPNHDKEIMDFSDLVQWFESEDMAHHHETSILDRLPMSVSPTAI